MTVSSIQNEVLQQPHQKLPQKRRMVSFCPRADSIHPLAHVVSPSLFCCRSLFCSSPSLCCLLPPQPSFLVTCLFSTSSPRPWQQRETQRQGRAESPRTRSQSHCGCHRSALHFSRRSPASLFFIPLVTLLTRAARFIQRNVLLKKHQDWS